MRTFNSNSMLRILGVFLLTAAALSAGAAADPAEAPPREFVLELIETVNRVKKSDPEKGIEVTPAESKENELLSDRLNRMLDIEQISSYALLEHWEKLDEKNRHLFVSTFTELLKKVAYPNAAKFLRDLEVKVKTEKIVSNRAMVNTSVIHPEEGRIDIDYRLEQGKNSWALVDVYLDGVSLKRNLRTQCLKIIRDHSFEELISRMQEKIDERETADLKEVTGRD
ncbi:MAG: ABC transporter substrate-binding protein [Desulfobacteraceae bacterium]|nr:MAG: ABC transporter substrate-binding protein [Desulfobacteraceae bacterium]